MISRSESVNRTVVDLSFSLFNHLLSGTARYAVVALEQCRRLRDSAATPLRYRRAKNFIRHGVELAKVVYKYPTITRESIPSPSHEAGRPGSGFMISPCLSSRPKRMARRFR